MSINHDASRLFDVDIPDPMAAEPLRWGVLGAGWIAAEFVSAVQRGSRQVVTAIGSRDLAKARAFADRFGVPRAFGSYDELVASPDVDVVYVATPHSRHRDDALLAIAAGKHVLVEKAFTRNAAEAREVVAAARAAGVFAMEAMWTRFLPHMIRARHVLEQGGLGELISVVADHGQWFEYRPEGRLFNPELAGGALLDLGIYPISLAVNLLGLPSAVRASGTLTSDGVDGQEMVVFDYPDRRQAVAHSTLWARTPTIVSISGTEARIEMAGPFYGPVPFDYITRDGDVTHVPVDEVVRGYEFEAAEVARRVDAGELESPGMPLDETVAIMEILDSVRAQLGVRYPGEGDA